MSACSLMNTQRRYEKPHLPQGEKKIINKLNKWTGKKCFMVSFCSFLLVIIFLYSFFFSLVAISIKMFVMVCIGKKILLFFIASVFLDAAFFTQKLNGNPFTVYKAIFLFLSFKWKRNTYCLSFHFAIPVCCEPTNP